MTRVLGYIATCTVNGKRYVGITSGTLANRIRKHLNASRSGSRYHFHRALRLHGSDAFTWAVEGEMLSWGGACKWERQTIERLKTSNPVHGYNLTGGGEGSYGLSPSQETRDRISATLKAWHASGDPRAAEVRGKVSLMRQQIETRPETRLKQAEAGRRRKLSEASRRKLSASKRRYSAEFVAEVVAYAQAHGQRAAERQFHVPRPSIRRWLREASAFPLVSRALQIETQIPD